MVRVVDGRTVALSVGIMVSGERSFLAVGGSTGAAALGVAPVGPFVFPLFTGGGWATGAVCGGEKDGWSFQRGAKFYVMLSAGGLVVVGGTRNVACGTPGNRGGRKLERPEWTVGEPTFGRGRAGSSFFAGCGSRCFVLGSSLFILLEVLRGCIPLCSGRVEAGLVPLATAWWRYLP